MSTVQVRHRVDTAALARLYLSDKIANNMFVRGLLVESRAKIELSVGPPRRVDTGRLRADISTRRILHNGRRGAQVGTGLKYSLWVHNGTGIYGPLHKPITPKHHTFLRFRPKGSKKFVFVRSVKGMKPNPYLLRALPAAKLR